MPDPLYLIWSNEHGAWWKPGSMGYTRSLREAGRYNYHQAADIVARASVNGMLRLENGEFPEVMIAEPPP
jgi:hypothetical protein